MPRKITQVKEEKPRPSYISESGELDLSKIFKHQVKQTELLRTINRNGKSYIQTVSRQCLSTGGIRSGKTSGWLMYLVMYYCLAFKKCDILVLRRTFKELESGAIADFKTFVPQELYTYDQTKHVATFVNGSRVVFGHCQNNKERDIEQYLGQAYPGILIDECGQFSPDAWHMLFARNIVNASCEADEVGNFPTPVIIGATNPIGPHYEFYRTVFVEKEPWQKPDDAKKDLDGCWWTFEAGTPRLLYDPQDYAYQRSTVLDNPEMLRRDPTIISRLDSLPKAKRDKMLLGLDGRFEGQYFDCWSEEHHTVNLREDPEAIIWQHQNPVWGSQDYGIGGQGHASAGYLFTQALVRKAIGDEYKLKIVCFKEHVATSGQTLRQWASLFAHMCKLPNGTPVTLKTIYFSHEKFSRQGTMHTPADEYTAELRKLGLPAVTRAGTDRIGRASLAYNLMKNGELVILDTCKEVLTAIPALMRDPDNLDDVLKTSAKSDDIWDGFSYGLTGYLAGRKRPAVEAIMDHAKTLDPLAAHFYKLKMLSNRLKENAPFVPPDQPVWVGKMNQL